MKAVSENLNDYLNTEKNLTSCDLYELELANGHTYYYTDADIDMHLVGKTYKHDTLLIKRQQTKLDAQVVVDSLNVTISATDSDKVEGVPIMQAVHEGLLDRAILTLKRCFFRGQSVLDTIGLFKGYVEIRQVGGLQIQLTVKAKTQGMSQEFPRRRYYPQGSYSTTDGKVSADAEDNESCLIAPFVPLKEALL